MVELRILISVCNNGKEAVERLSPSAWSWRFSAAQRYNINELRKRTNCSNLCPDVKKRIRKTDREQSVICDSRRGSDIFPEKRACTARSKKGLISEHWVVTGNGGRRNAENGHS